MSKKKQFVLIVVALVVPFLIVFGIGFGVIINNSGNQKSTYTYMANTSVSTSTETHSTVTRDDNLSYEKVSDKTAIIGRWIQKTTSYGLPVPDITANDITSDFAETFGQVKDSDLFDVMEFFNDGTLHVTRYIVCESIEDEGKHFWDEDVGDGTYSISDGLRLRLSYEIGKSKVADVLNVKLSETELVLYDDASGFNEVFNKLNEPER